jgi:alkylation response protein AidB-like acyl-CoA dehydrogenase
MPEEGLADFMVDGRLPRTTAGVAVTGTAVPVQGGYRVTARWPFGSGGLHAEILGGNVRVAGTDPPRVIGVHFPTEQATIHDNWDVTSLKGTGSGDVEVADLFVPAAMTYDTFGPPARGGALYAIGLPGLVANEHGAFVLGAARRAIDETAALAKSKTRGYVVPQGVAAREVFQADLGRADIAVRAARAHLDRVNGEAWQAALDGRPIDVAMQTELRCAAVHATDTALEVARRMFRYAGAKSLFAGNVIDRCLRDITAAAQHGMVNETSWEARGRVLLGFEDVAPIS